MRKTHVVNFLPHESKTVLDFGFQSVDSGFLVLDSRLCE